MERLAVLRELAARNGVLAFYLFGSRAEDGLVRLRGAEVNGDGSDLDVGVFFVNARVVPDRLGALQVEVEEVFAPLRVDLVPLDRVDALMQAAAIQGTRLAETDSTAADERELEVMRRAAELLPVQRNFERAAFGVATT